MNKVEMKKVFSPIAEGLFGKQKTQRYEKPHYIVRPINMMLEDLVQNDDISWGKYAFSREPLNGKFDDEQRRELTLKSNACGVEFARKYVNQYQESEPLGLADKLGIKVNYPEVPQNADRVLFAEYKNPNNVFIYLDSVKKAYDTMNESQCRDILGNDLNITNVLLAHELFHYIEKQNAETIFTRTEKVELWAPKPLHNRSGIDVLSEIAAMAFARELTGLSYSPYVMDVFLVYGYNPEEASGLYEEMMEYAGKIARLPEDTKTSLEEIITSAR